MPLSPHRLHFCDCTFSTAYQQLYSTRPLQLPGKTATRCVISQLMSDTTSHDIDCMKFLNGMVTGQFSPLHTALNLVNKPNSDVTYGCQLDRNCDHRCGLSSKSFDHLVKVFESIMRDKIIEHIERHKLLKGSQHGFVRRRSCLTNLLVF